MGRLFRDSKYFRLALRVEKRRLEDDRGPVEGVEGAEGGLDINVDLEYWFVLQFCSWVTRSKARFKLFCQSDSDYSGRWRYRVPGFRSTHWAPHQPG